jgi:hypothetical protein
VLSRVRMDARRRIAREREPIEDLQEEMQRELEKQKAEREAKRQEFLAKAIKEMLVPPLAPGPVGLPLPVGTICINAVPRGGGPSPRTPRSRGASTCAGTTSRFTVARSVSSARVFPDGHCCAAFARTPPRARSRRPPLARRHNLHQRRPARWGAKRSEHLRRHYKSVHRGEKREFGAGFSRRSLLAERNVLVPKQTT